MPLDEPIAGMTCAEVLACLSDYLDGDLATERRAAMEAHVGACRNCERFGGMLGGVIRRIREQLDADGGLDEAAAERLRRRLDQA